MNVSKALAVVILTNPVQVVAKAELEFPISAKSWFTTAAIVAIIKLLQLLLLDDVVASNDVFVNMKRVHCNKSRFTSSNDFYFGSGNKNVRPQ